jgi:hypothetical protein
MMEDVFAIRMISTRSVRGYPWSLLTPTTGVRYGTWPPQCKAYVTICAAANIFYEFTDAASSTMLSGCSRPSKRMPILPRPMRYGGRLFPALYQ